MSFFVEVMPPAFRDARSITNYLEQHSVDAAIRWENSFEQLLDRLATRADICPKSFEDRYFEETLRDAYFGKSRRRYRAITLIRGQTVYVLRVRGPRQDVLRPGEIKLPPE